MFTCPLLPLLISTSTSHWPLNMSPLFFFFYKPLSLFCASHILMGAETFTRSTVYLPEATCLKKNDFSSPRSHQLSVNSFSPWGGGSCAPPPCRNGLILGRSCAGSNECCEVTGAGSFPVQKTPIYSSQSSLNSALQSLFFSFLRL